MIYNPKINGSLIQTDLNGAWDMLAELTRRVNTLEEIAAEHKPYTAAETAALCAAWDRAHDKPAPQVVRADFARVPEWDIPATYSREYLEACEKEAYSAGVADTLKASQPAPQSTSFKIKDGIFRITRIDGTEIA